MGRSAGEGVGYRYSGAMKGSDVKWTAETMFAWLTNPKRYIKGTSMAFPGIKNPTDRTAVRSS